ncbi:hypothetical protein [Deinococcus aquiradiocola]|uniref:Uncharacterized protein n=1 Tax=Deinococcus aquiradiocola TaxID=393059 RepID=A0A917UQW3_9DEIO|nr:hypothetical protein [Deinococcus aquiradiocola]GGJ77907.1 hypothetical protein GCM10008939_22390 [Deinococcus aquiradiocola]
MTTFLRAAVLTLSAAALPFAGAATMTQAQMHTANNMTRYQKATTQHMSQYQRTACHKKGGVVVKTKTGSLVCVTAKK